MTGVFDGLEEFVAQLADIDSKFVVFLHNLSKYNGVE